MCCPGLQTDCFRATGRIRENLVKTQSVPANVNCECWSKVSILPEGGRTQGIEGPFCNSREALEALPAPPLSRFKARTGGAEPSSPSGGHRGLVAASGISSRLEL